MGLGNGCSTRVTRVGYAAVYHRSTFFSFQVLRSLGTKQEQHTRGGSGGAVEQATLLWQNIKRAAHSETDPIARHFLRPIATPVLQVRPVCYSAPIPRTLSTAVVCGLASTKRLPEQGLGLFISSETTLSDLERHRLLRNTSRKEPNFKIPFSWRLPRSEAEFILTILPRPICGPLLRSV